MENLEFLMNKMVRKTKIGDDGNSEEKMNCVPNLSLSQKQLLYFLLGDIVQHVESCIAFRVHFRYK